MVVNLITVNLPCGFPLNVLEVVVVCSCAYLCGSRIITHVSSPLIFLLLNNIGINATNGDFACSTNCHI